MPDNCYFFVTLTNPFKRNRCYVVLQFSIYILITILISFFCTKAHAAQVMVTLTPSIDERCVGHKIYYGQSTDFSKQSDMGSDTTYLTPSLQRGAVYYFAASAYDKYGNESELSNIVPYQVPESYQDPDDGNNGGISFELKEDFENYAAGDNPSGWFDTGASNSMEEDSRLFKVFAANNQKVFGTTSTLLNIHSHHIMSYIENLTSFEYSGRMMMTDPNGGVGVTFLSHYPFSDTYYRLRCTRNNSSFHIAERPQETTRVWGTKDTGVVPIPNEWYRFRIKVQDTGSRTEILAKVWHEHDPEPEHWQIDAYDDTPQRLVSGSFGVWSGHAGAKYWDDLTVVYPNNDMINPDDPGSGGSTPFIIDENFEDYFAGDNPSDWFDTGARNSMEEDSSLFKVYSLNDEKVFGTRSTLLNIHSHHIRSYIENLTSFEYSGRMMMTDPNGGVGVTFLSHYPFSDTYYRLRCTRNNSSFHIAERPQETTRVLGTKDTGVVPLPNEWYRFRIRVQDTGTRTEILAKVWHEHDPEPEHWQIDAYDDTSQRLVSGTFGVWSGHAGAKYWDDLAVTEPGKSVDDKDNSDSIEIIEDFENYSAGDNPSNWFDTQARNSMVEDNSLFKVFANGSKKVFGTTSRLLNIHSHHIAAYIDNLSSFEYSGRMMMTDPDGGIGVTFLSHYPFSDTYYRLRCTRNHSSFHLAPHPHGTAVVFGTTDTGVVPQPNEWYRFRIKVQDTGYQTEILAKVWPEHASEPHQWQIDAYDDSPQRLVSGTFGVWSGHAGFKYWDDLRLFK